MCVISSFSTQDLEIQVFDGTFLYISGQIFVQNGKHAY